MKTIEVEVNYGRTVNMGNYESLRLDYTVRAQVGEGESTEETLDFIKDELKGLLERAIQNEIHFIQGGKKLVAQAKDEAAGEVAPSFKPSGRKIRR